MKQQHTPGPWTATETGVYSRTISRHGNFYVATLPHPNEEPDETDAANLRLIAAAPELLGALKELARQSHDAVQWLKRCDALLIKNDGRDPSTQGELGEVTRTAKAIESARSIISRIEATK